MHPIDFTVGVRILLHSPSKNEGSPQNIFHLNYLVPTDDACGWGTPNSPAKSKHAHDRDHVRVCENQATS